MSAFGDALRQRVNFRGAQIAGNAREGLERALKQAAPVGKSSPWQTHEPGQLRGAVAVNVRFDQVKFTFHAVADVDYASFSNDGTPSHFIVAMTSPKKVLRFDWPKQGLHPAFIRGVGGFPAVVSHPGTQAQRWWSRTLEQWPAILRDAQ